MAQGFLMRSSRGQSADRPGLLLELRSHAPVNGVVAGIVGAGSNLIDQ